MTEQPTLRTERLTLRRFRLNDVDDVLAYANDEEWQRYLAPLPYPYERVHAEQFVAESFLADWKSKPTFAIVLDHTVIGGINLSIDKRHQTAEMGYSIARKALGERLRNRSGSLRRRLGLQGILPGQNLRRGECRQQTVMARDGANRHDQGGRFAERSSRRSRPEQKTRRGVLRHPPRGVGRSEVGKAKSPNREWSGDFR